MDHNSLADKILATNPEEIFDLYEWLPGHGETSVSFRFEGSELVVEVSYDDEEKKVPAVSTKTVRFNGVCAFYVSASPGVDLMRVEYASIIVSGAVVEYRDSDAARLWQHSLAHRQRPIRHYQVFFLAENRRLEVFAEDCVVV